MLSVILYGRNDSYGYNLHKRAAISLNCIAEILDSKNDEILFVDYNTPDDLPTFPEAIRDTLTEKAKKVLRILRVRPEVHARFADETHLIALEPISRNVALRRANPENRWVLSTNTDMIFLPRTPRSLRSILVEADDALYHLPRFEIPETLWEGFNRLDPRAIMDDVRYWAARAHLNEVVYGSETILYDGPGDFQLFPRQALIDIDGFDETMIKGWHVDSNLAKRLSLKLGPIRSFLDHMFGYHCDHTRMSTPAHRRERIENDARRYVTAITAPEIADQRDSWGCPDDDIDEIRLGDEPSSYSVSLNQQMPISARNFTEAAYNAETFDKVTYSQFHVAPFLIDLFATVPRRWNVGWAGNGRELFRLFVTAWKDLGFSGRILVHADFADLVEGESDPIVDILPTDEFFAQADCFVFEYFFAETSPASEGAATAPERSTKYLIRRLFLQAVAVEKAKTGERLRRFVFVNGIHNSFEELVTKHIGITFTPFSSRLRHGYVYREQAAPAAPVAPSAAGTLRPTEFARLASMVEDAMHAEPDSLEWSRVAKWSAIVLAQRDRLARIRSAAARPEKYGSFIEFLETQRASKTLLLKDAQLIPDSVAPPPPAERSLNRFCEFGDWEHGEFIGHVDDLFDQIDPRAWYRRSSWHWERAHLLYGCERLEALDRSKTALYMPVLRDRLLGALSDRLERVEVLNLATEERWTRSISTLSDGWYADASRINVLDQSVPLRDLPEEAYDLVMFPHGSVGRYGPMGFVALLQGATRALKVDGVIALAAEVGIGSFSPDAEALWTIPIDDEFWGSLDEILGLQVEPFDRRISSATVDGAWESNQPIEGELYFLRRDEAGNCYTASAFFLRKVRSTVVDVEEQLQLLEAAVTVSALVTLENGDVVPRTDLRHLNRIAADALESDAGRQLAGRYRVPLAELIAISEPDAVISLPDEDRERLLEILAEEAPPPFASEDYLPSPDDSDLSRLAEFGDWSHDSWRRYFLVLGEGRVSQSIFGRNHWLWARTHLLYGLSRHDLLREQAAGMCMVYEPDLIITAMAGLGMNVTAVSLSDWHQELQGLRWGRSAITPEAFASLAREQEKFDFVLAPQDSLVREGITGFIEAIADAARLLKLGGLFGFTVRIPIADEGHPRAFPMDADLLGQIEKLTGLKLCGLPPLRISAASAARIPVDDPAVDDTFMTFDNEGTAFVTGVWFMRKPDDLRHVIDRAALRIFQRRWFSGEKLPMCTPGAGVVREGRIMRVVKPTEGHAVFGPYDRGVPGAYAVAFRLEDIEPAGRLEIVVEVAINEDIITQQRHVFSQAVRETVLDDAFVINASDGKVLVEYRIWSNGGGTFTVSGISVQHQE